MMKTSINGSSPHTRGARPAATTARRCSRIIPAYAGSTFQEVVRGAVALGSSPHTRGARLSGAAVVAGGGIIPAYAGSTASGRWADTADGDHPRIRGEHHQH